MSTADHGNDGPESTGRAEPGYGLVASARVERDDFALSLDLRVPPGRTIGLTGGIGAGKTTALLLLAGRLRADVGSISHDGIVWDEPSTKTFVENRPVAMMSQLFLQDLPENVTGDELIEQAVTAAVDPGPPSTAADSARDLLTGLGVEPHVSERLPWTWSGAEAQRIALARAVAARPRLLLLDEPFTALDKRTGAAVRAWLGEVLLGFDGIAVIASTRADHLEALVDDIISLDD